MSVCACVGCGKKSEKELKSGFGDLGSGFYGILLQEFKRAILCETCLDEVLPHAKKVAEILKVDPFLILLPSLLKIKT